MSVHLPFCPPISVSFQVKAEELSQEQSRLEMTFYAVGLEKKVCTNFLLSNCPSLEPAVSPTFFTSKPNENVMKSVNH